MADFKENLGYSQVVAVNFSDKRRGAYRLRLHSVANSELRSTVNPSSLSMRSSSLRNLLTFIIVMGVFLSGSTLESSTSKAG